MAASLMRPSPEKSRLSVMSEAQRRERYAGRLLQRLQYRHRSSPDALASVDRAAALLARLERAPRTGEEADRLRALIGLELAVLGQIDPLSGLLNGFSGISASSARAAA